MSVIEFQTYIQHGTIAVPNEYLDQVKGRVRVILLTDEADGDFDMVEHLLEHPYNGGAVTPFTRDEIYDRH
jgi:hypothetical protein